MGQGDLQEKLIDNEINIKEVLKQNKKKALKEEMYNNGYEFEQKENRRLEKKKQMCFN